MKASERTLSRLLNKPAIAAFLARESERFSLHNVVVDAQGQGVLGRAECVGETPHEIRVGDRTIGSVHGPDAKELAELLQLLAGQDAETRALAQESLERYKEVTMLYSVSEKIISAADSAAVAVLIAEEAQRFLHSDSTAVFLLNSETNRLELAAGAGLPFHERATRDIGDDIVGSVIRTGVGEIVNDVGADPRALNASSALASIVCSPLKSAGRVFGILVAGSQAQRHYNAGDLKILSSIAAQAADAIEVARLGRELKTGSHKPVNLIYGADERPPPATLLVLGFQHVLIALMSLAYPVLVTLEAGGSRLAAASVVSMSLIAMAIATLLQVTRRGPVGSGYLAPYITSVIFLGPSLLAARMGGLALVSGMTILTGILGLILAQVLRRFRKLFPPEVSGIVVLMVGLSMVPLALPRFLGIGGTDTLSEPAEWLVGFITLGTIISLSVLPLGRLRLYATAVGIAVGYAAAVLLGILDVSSFETVRGLPMLGWQTLALNGLSFEPALIVPFVVAALASNIKEAGLVISCQKTNDAQWKRPAMGPVSGGIVASGLGNIVAGGLGGVGLGISAGNVGLAAATGATARVIGVVTAAFFLALAFMPQVTATLALMPSPVMGAGLLFVACHLVSSGAELITARMLDARRNYVVGLSLLAGVGLMVTPNLFAGAPAWVQAGLGSPLALSTIMALVLNLVLNVGVSSRARLQLAPAVGISDAVSRFFERQGAKWGARGDVIRRAAPAVTEWCEELRHLNAATHVDVELLFDEFRLVATVRSDMQGGRDEAGKDATIVGSRAHIATTIARRYDCTVKIIDRTDVSISFEH